MSNNNKQKQGEKGCTRGDKGKEKKGKRREGKGGGRGDRDGGGNGKEGVAVELGEGGKRRRKEVAGRVL